MHEQNVHQRIGQIPFVAELDDALAKKLTTVFEKVGKPQTIKPASVIYRMGEPYTDDAFVILDGEISVLKGDAPEVVATGPELIGEMGQFNPSRMRTATVTATTEIQALRFSWTDWKNEAQALMSTAELAKVTGALEDYAWRHFTQ